MGRLLRVLGAGAAVVAIALSPWAGAQRDTQKPAYYIDDDQPLYIPPAPAPALGTPMAAPFVAARPAAAGGCGCATVVINAVNELREVEVRTGDAKAVNNAVTYVSAGYAQNYENEIKVKVRQVSRAISGDAMAGQSISLAGGRGARCYNYVVKARNVLQDVEVRSGDAKAANHSTILLDPGVQPDRLDIKLRQVALARAGDATAGQFIGAAQGGGGRDGCGGVRIEATNLMNEVEVRSGEADGTNDNTVRTCAQVGCADELRELVPGSDTVQMCLKDDCITESPADVVAALPAASASPLPTLGVDPGTSIVDPEPTECPRYGPRGRRCRAALAEAAAAKVTPTPTAAPDESPTPTPDATVEPTPEPTPAPTTTPVAPPL